MMPSMTWTATKASHTSSAFVNRTAGNSNARVRSIGRSIGKENASNLAWDRAQPGGKRSPFGGPLSSPHGRSWESRDAHARYVVGLAGTMLGVDVSPVDVLLN